MTIEEMQTKLTEIHNQQFQTKLLNIILGMYNELKEVELALDATRADVNKVAETVNSFLQSDTSETETINK